MSKKVERKRWAKGLAGAGTHRVAVGDEAVEGLAGPRECGEGADGGESRRVHLCSAGIRVWGMTVRCGLKASEAAQDMRSKRRRKP